MFNQELFIEKFVEYVKTFWDEFYYERASKNAKFPYGVLIPPSTSDLMSGDLMMLDIEIYANELTGAVEVEKLQDLLRNKLHKHILNSEDDFASHINFENSFNLKERETDILARRITFSARVFYK